MILQRRRRSDGLGAPADGLPETDPIAQIDNSAHCQDAPNLSVRTSFTKLLHVWLGRMGYRDSADAGC